MRPDEIPPEIRYHRRPETVVTNRERFRLAVTALSRAGTGTDLCGPFVSAISVTGAAVTTLGNPLGTQTICASDATAARIDEIQADLGEGPCWTAYRTRLPVLEPDIQNGSSTDWPIARAALRETGVGAVHAFPLIVGDMQIGSVDLYTDDARALTAPQITDASALAFIAARQVLHRAFQQIAAGDPEMPDGEYSRREVHQASGMVSVQLSISVDDALLLLQGYAFGNSQGLRDVARAVVERRLDFSDPARGGDS